MAVGGVADVVVNGAEQPAVRVEVDPAVNDLIMPLISAVIGKIDFSNFFIALAAVPEGTATTLDAMKKAGVPVFAYGNFITVAVNFLILAFIIFLMIKQINRIKGTAEEAAPKEEVLLLRDIRDSLKK